MVPVCSTAPCILARLSTPPPGLDTAARSPSRPHHPTSHVIARDAALARLRDSIFGNGTGFPTPGTDNYSLNKDLITITVYWTDAGRVLGGLATTGF